MKQTFLKKTALFMCAVMLMCAIPFNVGAQSVNDGNSEILSGGTASDTQPSDTDVFDTIAIVVEIIETFKKVVGELITYISTYDEVDRPLHESGVAGYLYDPYEKCFYTSSDPWQRTVGYNVIFDVVSPTTFIDFDTVRFKFDYEKKNWIIQLWKGQYGLLFYGAEIGIYTKPENQIVEHYYCASDEDMLKMSMDFYRDGVKKFSRPYGLYWWCTGFIPGNVSGEFYRLSVDTRITMKNYAMLTEFRKALESAAEKTVGLSYSVKGLDVYISYH